MIDYHTPKQIMACAPFLQRMGWERVRPQQNISLDTDYMYLQKIPVEYPVQAVEHVMGFRTEEPLHGISVLQPYSEHEILKNSNYPNE